MVIENGGPAVYCSMLSLTVPGTSLYTRGPRAGQGEGCPHSALLRPDHLPRGEVVLAGPKSVPYRFQTGSLKVPNQFLLACTKLLTPT